MQIKNNEIAYCMKHHSFKFEFVTILPNFFSITAKVLLIFIYTQNLYNDVLKLFYYKKI